MGEHRIPLVQVVNEELAQQPPPEALVLSAAIRRRHGTAVAAILFYGSCLRKRKSEDGVLDFYVLVDSYRAAYAARLMVWLNVWLPPNVFYLEAQDGHRTIRAKYAVISLADFVQAASRQSLHAIVWARFCQPARLAYARDETARATVVHAIVQSILTFVTQIVALLPESVDTFSFRSEDLWQCGFRETYSTELRPESAEMIQELYRAAPGRYDQVARDALYVLEEQGILRACTKGRELFVTMSVRERRRLRLSWRIRRPAAKMLYIVRLLKSAATFGDWLPYVLWKIGRHAGVRLEPSEQQRRHPFLLGGPLILKLLLQRALR
jgi:hypothetical protein